MKISDPITLRKIETFVGIRSRSGIGNMGFNPLIECNTSRQVEVELATKDGQLVPDGVGTIALSIAIDSDVYPSFREKRSVHASYLRFRGFNGGSNSVFTHPALFFMFGALALCKYPERWSYLCQHGGNRNLNIRRISRMLTRPLSHEVEELCINNSIDASRDFSINRLHDDSDGMQYGHMRIKFLGNHILAKTDTTKLGSCTKEEGLAFEDEMVAEGIMSRDWCRISRPKHDLPVKPKDPDDFQARLLWNAFHILAIAMLGDQKRRPLPA